MQDQLAIIPQPHSVIRKDKYEKKLLWYWCDIAYEATKATKDEEELIRETDICDGAPVSDVGFGLGSALPNLDSDDESDSDDQDDDEDDDEEKDDEAEEPKAKLARRKSKESQQQEDPDEATCCLQIAFNMFPLVLCMLLHDPKVLLCLDRTIKQLAKDIEGIPGLLDDILKLQGRSAKLLKRCQKAGAPEPRGHHNRL